MSDMRKTLIREAMRALRQMHQRFLSGAVPHFLSADQWLWVVLHVEEALRWVPAGRAEVPGAHERVAMEAIGSLMESAFIEEVTEGLNGLELDEVDELRLLFAMFAAEVIAFGYTLPPYARSEVEAELIAEIGDVRQCTSATLEPLRQLYQREGRARAALRILKCQALVGGSAPLRASA